MYHVMYHVMYQAEAEDEVQFVSGSEFTTAVQLRKSHKRYKASSAERL
jgi:hypothetical protein